MGCTCFLILAIWLIHITGCTKTLVKMPLYFHCYQRLWFKSAYKFINALPCLKLDLFAPGTAAVVVQCIEAGSFPSQNIILRCPWVISGLLHNLSPGAVALWQHSWYHFIYLTKPWLNSRGLQQNYHLFWPSSLGTQAQSLPFAEHAGKCCDAQTHE